MKAPALATLSLLLLTGLLTTGCSSVALGDSDSSTPGILPAGDAVVASQLPPGGSKINYTQSLIIGSGATWMGRLVVELSQNSGSAYNFFLEQYPKQGWTVISAVRGKNSLLVFSKPDRSATVELTDGGVLGGAMATLTVSPRSSLTGAPAAVTLPAAPPASR